MPRRKGGEKIADKADKVSNETKEKLIDLVRNIPPLWNTQHVDYKDSTQNGDSWTKLSDDLKIDAKDTWTKLKNSFSGHRRDSSLESRSGAAGGKKKKWIFWDKMQFINDHVEVRTARNKVATSYGSNISDTASSSNTADEIEEMVNENDDDGGFMQVYKTFQIPADISTRRNSDEMMDEDETSSVLTSASSSLTSNSKGKRNSQQQYQVVADAMKEAIRSIKPPTSNPKINLFGIESLPEGYRKIGAVVALTCYSFNLLEDPLFAERVMKSANNFASSLLVERNLDKKFS